MNRQKKVMETVWPWRSCRGEAVMADSPVLRRRAVREAIVLLALGTFAIFAVVFLDAPSRLASLAIILVCVSVFVFVSGMWFQSVYSMVKRLGDVMALVLGTIVAWSMLVPFYYIVFTLGRLFMVVTGKDSLNRKFPTDIKTYWEEWKAPENKERYKQQF